MVPLPLKSTCPNSQKKPLVSKLTLYLEVAYGELFLLYVSKWYMKMGTEKNEKGHGDAGWWMDQFKNADFDHNGSLDIEEFDK